ncbi:MAG: hypothetical protein LBH64_00460, partial [Coriobacteriales bacterium]|nr:hypothetical protein [Coriobacteriales bacterium]
MRRHTTASEEQDGTPRSGERLPEQPSREPEQPSREPEQAPEKGSIEQVNRLGTAKVTKLMVEFAIPSIIGLV